MSFMPHYCKVCGKSKTLEEITMDVHNHVCIPFKYTDCHEEDPPLGVLIYGLRYMNENEACICRWTGDSWGSHISISKWRHLTQEEQVKLDRGELKEYTMIDNRG